MGYPQNYARSNCLCAYYSEIAYRHFYKVKQRYLFYEKSDFTDDIFIESRLVNENKIISVVFAQMAIESFLNDYAAACLGDDEFYDNFDKLDNLGKLHLITKFILKENLDKSREPYNSLKSLNKLRNNYIHNKSFTFDFSKQMDGKEFCDEDYSDIFFDIQYKTELKDYKEMFHEAKIALKAMAELAKFFDARDNNVSAKFRFFGFISNPIDLDAKEIQKELKNLGIFYEVQI